MSLGQNIYELRKEKNLSQEELAEKLEVSRQSVSKWETDASVPDLDKLIKLSEIFGVTVDELIKGKAASAEHPTFAKETFSTSLMKGMTSGRLAAVVILMGLGGFAFLLFTGLGGLLLGLVMALPFICCGIICMVSRKRPLLWCLWALFFMGDAFLTFSTGAGSMSLLLSLKETGLTVQTIIVGIRLLLYLALVVFTVLSFRKTDIKRDRKTVIWLCISLGIIIVIHIGSFLLGRAVFDILASIGDMTVGDSDYQRYHFWSGLYGVVSFITKWLRWSAFTAAATLGVNMIRNRKRDK